MELAVAREQQQIGDVRVVDERAHGMADHGDRLAHRERLEPARSELAADLGEQRRSDGRRRDHGLA